MEVSHCYRVSKGFSSDLCYYHPIGKHASITPSASTSVTNERESGVGGVASDEGGTRGKNQSNDSNKTMMGGGGSW